MKNFLTIFSIALILVFFLWAGGDESGVQAGTSEESGISAAQDLKVTPDFGKIPLYFIPNQGQVHEKALYYTKAREYTLWLSKEGLIFDSVRAAEKVETSGKREGIPRYERDVSQMFFIGVNENVEIAAAEKSEYKVHYFIGNEKSHWRTNIPTSEAVVYKGIYKNIDLLVYGVERQIEYDWVVKPGADVDDIRVKYQGVKGTRIDEDGNLVIATKFGELMHRRPVSYQEIEGKRVVVDVAFKQAGENIYGFEPEEYDGNYVLTIDPAVLVYSTYLGGNGLDSCSGIAVDSNGNAYVTGITRSSNFPLQDAIDTTAGASATAFVTKFSVDGSTLEYSCLIGGNSYEDGYDIAVGTDGAAYVTGRTTSSDFPTKNPFDNSLNGGEDAFVTQVVLTTTEWPPGSGNFLTYVEFPYATYLGGSHFDQGYGIALDSLGDIYVTGRTLSSNFPCVSPYDNSRGGTADAFISRFYCWSSMRLLFSTYLGGSSNDKGLAITVDSNIAVYIGGSTESSNFPTQNPFQGAKSTGEDAIVTKMNFIITKNDFNNDGQPDILWRHYGNGANVLAYLSSSGSMAGLNQESAAAMSMDRGRGPAQVYQSVWEAGETLYKDERVYHDVMEVDVPREKVGGKVHWNAIDAGDVLNRSGEAGIGGDAQELMKPGNLEAGVQAISIIGFGYLTTITDVNWRIEGAGDFNGNGKVDILWRHYGVGWNALWYMNGSAITGTEYLPTVPDVNWRIENH